MSNSASPSVASPVSKTADRVWAVLLFCLAVLPFLPALRGEFTWDDDQWLVDNAAVHAWNGLSLIWNPYRQSLHFYPMTFTFLWLEHKLWELHPLGYHLSNMLTHAGSAVLLWLSLRRLKLKAAWLAALLWAIHPVQVESVAWVAEIKNTLSGLFYFAALWAYLRFERIGEVSSDDQTVSLTTRDWKFYSLTFLCLILALLTKTVVCTLPAALLLILWWQRKKLSLHTLLPLVPLLVVALSFAAWSAGQEHSDLIVGGANNLDFTPLERCIIAGKDLMFYLRTLVVPFPLMPIYPRWTYVTHNLLNWLPLVGIFWVVVALWLLRKRTGDGPLVGLLYFVGTLAPALGFVNFFTMHYTFVADHYQYLACAGILVPLVEMGARALSHAARSRPRFHDQKWSMAAGVALCALIMPLTAFYASLFQTNFKLWSWNVSQNPAAFTAQHNLALAYFNAGDIAAGNHHLDIALGEQPDDDNIQRTVGKRCLMRGDYPAALAHFQRALEQRPRFGATYMLIGDTYLKMGRLPEALAAYEKSIALDGGDARYYIAYAEALKAAHQYEHAADMYATSLLISPGNLITRYNYANLLLDMNKPLPAIEQYRFILKYQENNSMIWDNLAAAYYQAGQMSEAISAKQRARALDAAASTTEPR